MVLSKWIITPIQVACKSRKWVITDLQFVFLNMDSISEVPTFQTSWHGEPPRFPILHRRSLDTVDSFQESKNKNCLQSPNVSGKGKLPSPKKPYNKVQETLHFIRYT